MSVKKEACFELLSFFRTNFPFAWTLGGNVSKNWEETGGGGAEVLFVPSGTTTVSKRLEVARRYNRNARGGKITLQRQVIHDKLSHIDFRTYDLLILSTLRLPLVSTSLPSILFP